MPQTRPVTNLALAIALVLAVLFNLFAVTLRPTGIEGRERLVLARDHASRADVILIGNSWMNASVSASELARRIDRRVVKLWHGGVGTAWWYLGLKNAVVPTADRPKVVVMVFEGDALTVPDLGVQGEFRRAVESMSLEHEPDIERLAHDGSTLDARLRPVLPILAMRDATRSKIGGRFEGWFRTLGGGPLLDLMREGANRSFDPMRFDEMRLANRAAAGRQVAARDRPSFEDRVARSFLPAMLELSRVEGHVLVLVRIPSRDETEQPPTPESEEERRALAAYLEGSSAVLVDLVGSPLLSPSHYRDAVHTNEAGRLVVTDLLGERLAPLLPRSET